MKFKKIISAILAATMVTACTYSAVLAEDSNIVYTYVDENGQTVNITQAELDAEHWNVDALGDAVPVVYEDFPMSIDGFINDFAELSLSLRYMKKLQDFSSVHLTITDTATNNNVYDSNLTQNAFYSPVLSADKQYIVTLTETIGNVSDEYKRIVNTETVDADMPDFVSTGSGDDVILVASVDDLKAKQTVSQTGEIIIDATTPVYDNVEAGQFSSYLNTLSSDKIYKVVADENGQRYMGFIDGEDTDSIFSYKVTVKDFASMYSISPMSVPVPMPNITTIKNEAEEIPLADNSFRLLDDDYKAFSFIVPSYMLPGSYNDNDELISSTQVRFVIRGDVSFGINLWVSVNNGSQLVSLNPETSSTTRMLTLTLNNSNFGGTDYSDDVVIYGLLYCPSVTEGNVMITPSYVSNYTDDVTGSSYDLLTNSDTPSEHTTFTEYNITDGHDVDVFYLKQTAPVYKVSIRNRSLEEQEYLENGIIMPSFSEAKVLRTYMVGYRQNAEATDADNVIYMSDIMDYTIPSNVDVTVYTSGSLSDDKSFVSVSADSIYLGKIENKYQISYEVFGNSGGGIEEG